MDEQITFLEIEKVDPPIEAARDFIDPEEVRELAESIRSEGLFEPIIVRPHDGRFEVVAGHRRWLAHRLIAETRIKAIVRDLTDEQVILIRAMENDQRVDLNPMEKAKGYKRLKDRFGWSDVLIAQKMGRHRNTIRNYLDLLDTPEEFQKEVARGKISMQVALCLNKIEDLEFRRFYFDAAVQNGVTLEVAESWVNDYRKTKVGPAQGGSGGMGDLGAIQEPLPIYGTCVICLSPVEVQKLRYIAVCGSCESQAKGALKSDKS